MLEDDPARAEALREGDGFGEGVTPRFGGFVHGRPVSYWTLEAGGDRAMPLYQLCRAEGDDDCVPIEHAPIVDAVPGDAGYSPYGQVHWVKLPEGWDGRLESLDAIEAAVSEMGLEPPEPSTELRHCAIASSDVELEVGPDMTLRAETPVYYRGLEARCFDFSSTRDNRVLLPDGKLFVRNVYLLTRDGEDQPLSEPIRMEDLTGDGDTRDSNNIFGVGLEDGDYTPYWRLVTVTVPAGLGSIDTSMDQTMAEYTDSGDMFDTAPDYTITPRPGQIVDHVLTDTMINCPLQSEVGSL